MAKKTQGSTYSIEQMKTRLEQYTSASAERLRARLKKVWKKQSALKMAEYDKARV